MNIETLEQKLQTELSRLFKEGHFTTINNLIREFSDETQDRDFLLRFTGDLRERKKQTRISILATLTEMREPPSNKTAGAGFGVYEDKLGGTPCTECNGCGFSTEHKRSA